MSGDLTKSELELKSLSMENILDCIFPKDLTNNYIDDMKTKLYSAWKEGKIRCTINLTDFLEGATIIKNGRYSSSSNNLMIKHNQIWLYYAELYKIPTMQQLLDFLNGQCKDIDQQFSEVIKGINFELIR